MLLLLRHMEIYMKCLCKTLVTVEIGAESSFLNCILKLLTLFWLTSRNEESFTKDECDSKHLNSFRAGWPMTLTIIYSMYIVWDKFITNKFAFFTLLSHSLTTDSHSANRITLPHILVNFSSFVADKLQSSISIVIEGCVRYFKISFFSFRSISGLIILISKQIRILLKNVM